LGLGVLEGVPEGKKHAVGLDSSSSGEVSDGGDKTNTVKKGEESVVMEDLLGKKASKKRKNVVISEVE